MNDWSNQETILDDEAPLDQESELLVAYLDNELSPPERSQLEDRLVEESGLRNRLSELEAGWSLLTEIPTEPGDPSILETTLAMAVAEFPHPSSPSKRGWGGWFGKVLLVTGATCLVAFALHAWSRQRDFDQQLDDLVIAQNLDAYVRGADIELLKQLQADPQWIKMTATVSELNDPPSPRGELQDGAILRKVPREERPAILKSMDEEDRMILHARWLRFGRLDEANQQTLRQTAANIHQQPDQDRLIATAKAYATWRERVDAELVAQIESSDPNQRSQAIRTALQQSRSRIARLPSLQLDEETIERIYFVLTETLQNRVVKNKKLKAAFRALRRRNPHGYDPRWYLIQQNFSSQRRPDRSSIAPIPPLSDRELRDIRLILSDEFNEKIDLVSTGDAYLETLAMQEIVDETIRRKSPLHNDATLIERFDQLSDKEQEQLKWLPAEKILQRLTRDPLGR